MLISGETARYVCKKLNIAFGAERVKTLKYVSRKEEYCQSTD